MKKQLKFTTKAHLIRGASYLLLLMGVCLSSFALAQGNNPHLSSVANLGHFVPASTMITGTHVPAKTPLNIPVTGQSQLVEPTANSPVASMWTSATPYPTIIARPAFAQTATHLYVFGGFSNIGPGPFVNRMDIATGTWESLAPMPWFSCSPTCALMESTGIVYCAQGDFGSGFASYNIATDTWTILASDPFVPDNYGSASGVFNGKVFVAGGGDAEIRKSVQIYDVATNTWSVGTAAPKVFLLAGYQQVGQFLYVVGGFDKTVMNNATTWRLDMSSAPGVWEIGPAFTPQRADFGLAYDAGTNKLYALGGDLPNDGLYFNSTDLVDELDVGSWPAGSWVSSPPNLPSPRQGTQAAFFGASDIWSVGGYNGLTGQYFADALHRNNGGGGELTLSATVRRVHGNRLVALSWTPADDGGDINVLRDGVVIQTTADDGRAQDRLGTGPREVHVYQVCETDTGTCSNEVKVKIPEQ